MLLRWVKQGVISPSTVGGELLFDEKVLNSWAAKRRMPIRQVLTASMNDRDLSKINSFSLTAVMAEGGVYFDIPGKDVKSVFSGALNQISLPVAIEKEETVQRLSDREALASTGIGGGIAIPHPRKPLAGLPETGLIATCFLESPVDFSAVDGQPVFVLFILFSPSTKRHLELLSKLSFCLSNPELSQLLPNVKDKKTLLNAISEVEESIQTGSA